jgi:hypothetical protein
MIVSVTSYPRVLKAQTVTETCGKYSKFHANRPAYDDAQGRALIAECAVIGTEEIAWRKYGTSDAHAQAEIDAAKKRALIQMKRAYPGIPSACATGLLNIAFLVISKHPDVKQGCMNSAGTDETDRQLRGE